MTEKKIFTVAEGTCTVRVHDGKTWTEIPMEAGDGVVLEGLLWKEITDISPGAIIPCFSSMDIGNTLMRGISDFEQFKDIAHKALYSGNSESN